MLIAKAMYRTLLEGVWLNVLWVFVLYITLAPFSLSHTSSSNVRYIALSAENELDEEFAERWMGMHHISQGGG